VENSEALTLMLHRVARPLSGSLPAVYLIVLEAQSPRGLEDRPRVAAGIYAVLALVLRIPRSRWALLKRSADLPRNSGVQLTSGPSNIQKVSIIVSNQKQG
jgi:hypothetical protein